MRKHVIALGLVAGILSAPAQSAAPQKVRPATAPEAAVADTMRQLFAALAIDDEAALRGIVTRDFYAFDGGHEMSADDLIRYVKWRHATGTQYTWSITDPRVQIAGNLATITYRNRGSISDASGTVPMTWLEAAILHLNAGQWKVQFIDSTRTPLPAGAATATIPDSSPKPTYHP